MLNIHEKNIYFYKELKYSKLEVQSKLHLYSEINKLCLKYINNYIPIPSDKLSKTNDELLKESLKTYFDTCIKINFGNQILKDILYYIELLERRPFIKEDGLLLYERLL